MPPSQVLLAAAAGKSTPPASLPEKTPGGGRRTGQCMWGKEDLPHPQGPGSLRWPKGQREPSQEEREGGRNAEEKRKDKE